MPFLGDTVTDFDDGAGAFVPQYLRRFFWKQALRDVDVSAADTGGVDFDDHVAWGWFGLGDVVEGEVGAAVPGLCLHVGIP